MRILAEEWNMPEFLNRDFEDIMEEMTAALPEDIDLSVPDKMRFKTRSTNTVVFPEPADAETRISFP